MYIIYMYIIYIYVYYIYICILYIYVYYIYMCILYIYIIYILGYVMYIYIRLYNQHYDIYWCVHCVHMIVYGFLWTCWIDPPAINAKSHVHVEKNLPGLVNSQKAIENVFF